MEYKQLAVIIPSYNDIDNLPLVLAGLEKEIAGATYIIVDDSSAQEKKKIPQLKKQFPQIVVIERKKKSGRGSAVLEGFRYALANKQIAYVIEMDADTSHDPRDLPRFLKKLGKADLIIGSRYQKESHIINWPLQRVIMSSIINKFFLRFLLQLSITDYTNGYRLYARKAAEYLINAKLHETGFLLLSETAFQLKKAGFSIDEVPITFTDRKFGKSSVTFGDLMDNLFGAFRIRLRD